MSEDAVLPSTSAGSAGAMLRQAREAAGLDLGVLAATIKVAQRKLELLEADRYDELPDAAFVRALALTVCRALKIDPAPVLAQLPAVPEMPGLEHVTQGLNQPFNERAGPLGRAFKDGGWGWLLRPGVVAPLALVAGAAALYLWPRRPSIEPVTSTRVLVAPAPLAASQPVVAAPAVPTAPMATGSEPAVEAPMPPSSEPPEQSPNAGEFAPASPPASAVTGAAAVVAPAVAAVASTPPATGSNALAVRAKEDSWVEVRDAGGRILLSRLLKAGEALTLNGAAPLQVKIGNAHGTELQFRGRAVDLSAAASRDNVARLELK